MAFLENYNARVSMRKLRIKPGPALYPWSASKRRAGNEEGEEMRRAYLSILRMKPETCLSRIVFAFLFFFFSVCSLSLMLYLLLSCCCFHY